MRRELRLTLYTLRLSLKAALGNASPLCNYVITLVRQVHFHSDSRNKDVIIIVIISCKRFR